MDLCQTRQTRRSVDGRCPSNIPLASPVAAEQTTRRFPLRELRLRSPRHTRSLPGVSARGSGKMSEMSAETGILCDPRDERSRYRILSEIAFTASAVL